MWCDQVEDRQATELLDKWAPCSVEDVLELISFEFKYPAVRRYAVAVLSKVASMLCWCR